MIRCDEDYRSLESALSLWDHALWGAFGGVAVELLAAIKRVKKFPWKVKGEIGLGPFLFTVVVRLGLGAGLAVALGPVRADRRDCGRADRGGRRASALRAAQPTGSKPASGTTRATAHAGARGFADGPQKVRRRSSGSEPTSASQPISTGSKRWSEP